MGQQSKNKSALGEKFNGFEFTPSNNLFDGIQDELAKDAEKGVLADKFSNFEQPVSGSLWPKIEKELHPEKKKRAIIWWGVAASLIILFSISSVDLFRGDLGQLDSVAENTQFEQNSSTEFSDKPLVKGNSSTNLPNRNGNKASGVFFEESAEVFGHKIQNKFKQPFSYEKNENYSVIGIAQKRLVINTANSEFLVKDSLFDIAAELFEGLEDKQDKKPNRKNNIAPYSGSLFSNGSNNGQLTGNQTALMDEEAAPEIDYSDWTVSEGGVFIVDGIEGSGPDAVVVPLSDLAGVYALVDEEIVLLDDYENEVGSDYKDYKPALSVGLLYERVLGKQLSIAAGVSYTVLNFNYDKGIWQDYKREGSEAYLGIPLNITYDLIKNSKFNLFPLIGGQVDFGIAHKETINNKELPGDVLLNSNSLGNHFSLLAGCGIGYDLNDHLSVFGQSIYQTNLKSTGDGFFKKTPSNMSFQAGLKVSF